MRQTTLSIAVLAASIVAASPVAAQSASALTLGGGASFYDLSGTGTEPVLTARAHVPVHRVVRVDISAGYMRYEAQTDRTVTQLFPEFTAVIARPTGHLRPEIGFGAGFAAVLSGGEESEPTLHAIVGLMVPLGAGPWALRPEARIRSVDPWTGSLVDVTIGLSRTL